MAAYEHRLAEPVTYMERPVATVFLMEPRAKQLARFGEPTQSVYSAKTGASYDVNNDDVIAQYLDALLSLDGTAPVDGGGRALFAHLSLQDGIAIRDALLGFFVKAKLSLFSARSTA